MLHSCLRTSYKAVVSVSVKIQPMREYKSNQHLQQKIPEQA